MPMDPYTLYQLLYGGAAAAGVGGLGAAGYGTYRAAKGVYNLVGKRKRSSPMGSMGSRYKLSKCRKTRSYSKSVFKQKSISAPASRVIDTKYVDQLTTFSTLKANNSVAGGIGAIAGGSTEGQRVGNDIRILKYLITMRLKHGSEATDQTFRLIIVRSKTGNDNTQPAISALLNTDPTGNYTPLSLRNVNNLEDFEILLDKMIVLKNSTGSTNHSIGVRNITIDTCFPQRFSGTADTSIIRNPVYWYMCTDATNTTTAASGSLSFRVMYSDI